jgi:hypothetical protein
VPGNEKCLWYVVPEFIPGTARFNVEDCILYIVWNLRNVGYSVVYTHPNLLYVSWKNHDEKYKERESPWAQVLEAAREQVIVSARHNTIPSVVPRAPPSRGGGAAATAPMRLGSRPSSALIPDTITAAESEIKRKSVLKKTSEYRPITAQMNEPVSSGATQQTGGGLTGTLTPRHVSFV